MDTQAIQKAHQLWLKNSTYGEIKKQCNLNYGQVFALDLIFRRNLQNEVMLLEKLDQITNDMKSEQIKEIIGVA